MRMRTINIIICFYRDLIPSIRYVDKFLNRRAWRDELIVTMLPITFFLGKTAKNSNRITESATSPEWE